MPEDEYVNKELCDERFRSLRLDLAEIKGAVKCLPALVQRVENHEKTHDRGSAKLLAITAITIAFLSVLASVVIAIVK